MSSNIKVSVETKECGIVIFSITGQLDASMVSMVNDDIQGVLESDCKTLIFDLEELNYVSSAGLRILLYAAKKMKSKNGAIALCALNNNTHKVLEISGMTRFFPVYDNKDSALAAINQTNKN